MGCCSQFLQLGHDTGCDQDLALGVQDVHHAFEHLNLPGDGVGEEVGIDKYLVWRNQCRVVLLLRFSWLFFLFE